MQGCATSSSLLHNPSSMMIPFTSPKTTTLSIPRLLSHQRSKFVACRSSSHQSPITEFNLYELLGVDASSDKTQIKEAYRALQKRCHPDIAGPPGHDMAIILNEAYALLCDPNSRLAYDKELAKVADLQGYTGRPIYSTWFGPENEQRAVFVDEVKCIGCLKCALFAHNTFAVESVYGRARVVAQWADPEHKIQEGIEACPVDCISMVERSDLAALEFIMSKQPRGRVRIGAGNTVGVRAGDIFNEVEKFKARYAQHTSSINDSKAHTESMVSAIQAIQMISNWLYWQAPRTDGTPLSIQILKRGTRRHVEPSIKKLKAAAAVRKQATTSERPHNPTEEYWVPSPLALPTLDPSPESQVEPTPIRKKVRPYNGNVVVPKKDSENPLRWVVPMGASFVAATVVRLQLEEPMGGGIKEHIGGSLALAIVNSSWMQVTLAGVTWYLIAMYIVVLLEGFRRK